jgi:hypothetical protein
MRRPAPARLCGLVISEGAPGEACEGSVSFRLDLGLACGREGGRKWLGFAGFLRVNACLAAFRPFGRVGCAARRFADGIWKVL